MTLNPNEQTSVEKKNRFVSALILIGISLFACMFGIGSVLFLFQNNGGNIGIGLTKTDYRDIPPQWIAYRQTSIFTCLVNSPTCFAVQTDDRFIVGSADPPSLSFFDGRGKLLQKIDLPEEAFAVAVGKPDTVFAEKIAVAHKNQIGIYSAQGQCEQTLKLPSEKSDVRSIVFTPDYLFAADTGTRRILRFNADNILDKTFGEPKKTESAEETSEFDGFVVYASPVMLTFSYKNGLLYITNPGRHRIDVFTTDGIYESELSWGEPSGNLSGFVGCCNPISLAVLSDGRIVTVEKSVSRVKIYRSDRQLDCVVAGPGILDHYPSGLTGRKRPDTEPNRRYFAAGVLADDRIAVFDFDGKVIRVFAKK